MKKSFNLNTIWIGTLIGALLPQFFMFLYWLAEFDFLSSMSSFYKYAIAGKILSPLISLCVVPNVGLLFLLMNKNHYRAGKGIILATILYGFFIVYLKVWVEHTFNYG